MAKVKIQGNASGTGVVTLTAPNTNTDRTITLPDVTSTLATSENFLSTGIDDNATAVKLTVSDAGINVNGALTTLAIKEDDSGNVGIGVVPDATHGNITSLQIPSGGLWAYNTTQVNLGHNCYYDAGGDVTYMSTDEASLYIQQNGTHEFKTAPSGTADTTATMASALTITQDGRGVSQFTARAWCNLNFVGTLSIRDSHNISSITDNGTGNVQFNFTNSMGNANFVYFGLIPRQWGNKAMVAENTDSSDRTQSTSRAIIGTRDSTSGTYLDSPRVMIGVFGD